MIPKYGSDSSLTTILTNSFSRQGQAQAFSEQLEGLRKVASTKSGLSRSAEGTQAAQHDAEVLKAATQFEGMLMQEMMKSMWQSVPSEGIGSGGKEEAMFRDMLNEAVAKDMSEHQSIGIRDIIIKDINKLDKKME